MNSNPAILLVKGGQTNGFAQEPESGIAIY